MYHFAWDAEFWLAPSGAVRYGDRRYTGNRYPSVRRPYRGGFRDFMEDLIEC